MNSDELTEEEFDKVLKIVSRSKWVRRWSMNFCIQYLPIEKCRKIQMKISKKVANSILNALLETS